LDGVLCFCQRLTSDHNPSSATSHVAETTGMCHHVQALSRLKEAIHVFFQVFFMSEYLVLTGCFFCIWTMWCCLFYTL
jgi:hypothetical protein